jgi:pimeloyl-ACP methyl ester carboxylesterase
VGRPDVVLEAGRNDVAASWQAVMALLSPHVHVVAYDRAGLGGSAPSADPVALARQVRDLESVITSAAAGPCVLAGHSWGGILVQLLAWRPIWTRRSFVIEGRLTMSARTGLAIYRPSRLTPDCGPASKSRSIARSCRSCVNGRDYR